jgi:DNA-binding CsgD family transcriptional regulator
MAGRASALLGRRSECDALDRLLDAARRGESRALVLHGEPGVGKTALLRYVGQRASGCRVVRAGGVQSEMEIAFAGLHQLCAPLLGQLDALPGPQRDALRTTFGLSAGDPPDRFLVGLAVLGLLSHVAEERPLVCVVDDAQWLDEASEQALTFVARRLLAEPIALVFARRDLGSDRAPMGLPELAIGGLRPVDARALLASAVSGPLDERVRDRIVAETRGNPLALLQLPRGMTPAELAGGFGLPDAHALQGRIEQSFERRVQALPADSQRLLLLAAAEPVGDPVLVWRGAKRLEIPVEAAHPASAAELLELDHRVRFPHPLVRSAVYRAASVGERQAVHRALAEVTDGALDPDRRAWHRARAAVGPDEAVAEELERSAGRAQARGGAAAEAAFLAQAAELTPDPARRAERQVAAADAKCRAGAFEPALALLHAAKTGRIERLMHVRIDLLRAQIAFAVERGRDAPEFLLRAAKQLESLDAPMARETYLEALFAALFADRLAAAAGPPEVAARARAGPPAAEPPTVADQLLDGLAALVIDGYAAAAPELKQALGTFRGLPTDAWLRWVPHAAHTALVLWDFERWQAIAEQQVRAARADGTLITLPISLSARIAVHVFAGELSAARVLLDEVETVAGVTGARVPSYGAVMIAAWQGDRDVAAELIETTTKEVLARGEGLGVTIGQWAGAVLHNGLGQHERAQAAAEQASEDPPRHRRAVQGISNWALIELVEAAARTGDAERAADALRRLSEQAQASGTDWALGIEARSRALLTDDEADYRDAIERLTRGGVGAFAARSHLIYGEWLRRARRRADARRELRTAHEQFVAMGFAAFADRAERELRAAGETSGPLTVKVTGTLTAQEAQVARMARDGLSNADIGARLFISPRTVQYHLQKVFAKLEISSRNQLAAVLGEDASPVRGQGGH